MRSRIDVAMLGALVVAGSTAWARDARACGGCFHEEVPVPTPESASVVTDHRMILALDTTKTTLWDQVEYSGDPNDFAWVLPVRGEVVVGVGSDGFMDTIDAMTTPTLHAPTPSCAYGGGYGGAGAGCGGGGSFADDPTAGGGGDFDFEAGTQDDSGVTVTGMSTIGPYDVVQVHGTDEGAIVGWLRAHHYAVPTDLEPMLQRYVDEGFDFVAVRLRPGAGVQAMRPIRVTFPGALPTLPLRMVAAGVGDHVGIKLFVIASGRWETQNFPTYGIDASSLTWNFAAQRSDYTAQRQKLADAWGGSAFASESSIDVYVDQLPPGVGVLPTPDGGVDADAHEADADADADAEIDAVSEATVDAYDAGAPPLVDPRTPDREVAFGSRDVRRITRLRADLPAGALAVDLQLQAASIQYESKPDLYLSRSINDSAVCPSSPSRSSGDCVCDLDAKPRTPTYGAFAAFVAVVFAGIRRWARR